MYAATNWMQAAAPGEAPGDSELGAVAQWAVGFGGGGVT